MLISAAVGVICAPQNKDNNETVFTLKDGENSYMIKALADTIRDLHRAGERVFVAGQGRTFWHRHCKKHHFQIEAALIVPTTEMDRAESENL